MREALITFLALILGDDHDLVVRLTAIEDAPADLDVGDAFTDDEAAAIAALYNVDDDTLTEITAALREAAQDPDRPIAEVADIADHIDGLSFVADVRTAAAEAEDAERAALLERVAPAAQDEGDEDGADGSDEDASDEGDGGDDGAEDTAADETTEDAPEPVLASAAPQLPRIGQVAARRTRGGEQLRATIEERRSQAQASWRLLDQIGDLGFGSEVDDEGLAAAMFERVREFSMLGDTRGSVPHPIARIEANADGYNGDVRGLSPADAAEVIDEYVRTAQASMNAGHGSLAQALVASGGLCTPRMPLYDIPTIAAAVRPVRDYLATFRADRGGVTFRPGRSIGTLGAVNTANSGIMLQSIARDEEGRDKQRLRVPCPTTENADVQAIPARLIHGNFLEQFDPEAILTAVTLQMALAARVAEGALLDAIDSNSDDVQTQTQGTNSVGFARFYLNSVAQVATGIRSRERTGRNFVVDHLAPFWVLDAIRDDLTLELPGSSDERLATADSTIESFFTARNIRTGWFIDQQVIGNQIDEGNVTAFPAEVVSYMFEPGHHVVLDGGEIRMGVYRDSALNQENDAETFSEIFEGLASRGVVSFALHSDICVTGATSAALDLPCGYVS